MKWQDKDRIMQEFLSFSVLFLIVWYTCTKFSGDFRYGAEGKMKIWKRGTGRFKRRIGKIDTFYQSNGGSETTGIFIGILMR